MSVSRWKSFIRGDEVLAAVIQAPSLSWADGRRGTQQRACPTLSTVTPDRGWVVCRSEGVVKLAGTQAKEKNNKPHEERGNQEQYKKATPSFNAWRPQLTVIFYHFSGGQVIYNNPTALYACFLHSCWVSVSWKESWRSILAIPESCKKKKTFKSRQICYKHFPTDL